MYEKRGLPAGTERVVHQGYEEVSIPATTRCEYNDVLCSVLCCAKMSRLDFDARSR